MNNALGMYSRYVVFGLVGVVVFGLSIWGGYYVTLRQAEKNNTVNGIVEPALQPAQEALETVSEETQVVNVDSLPDMYFQYAYSLTDEIWFSEITFEQVTVVVPPGANDETTMVVAYNGKRITVPLVGTVGLKIGEGEGSYTPARVRELAQTVLAGSTIRVGLLFTPVEVTPNASDIQTKLRKGVDESSEYYDLAMLNIAKRGVKKLTQEEIVDRLRQDEQIVFAPEEMMVSSIEVR